MTIDDEKVQFYLRHRDQLEEWLALRKEAAAAIDEWLAALRPDVEGLVVELGKDVEVVVDLEDPWPSLFLKRSAWPGDAAVLIGLQWARRKTLLGAESAPFVGVRSDRATPIGGALRDDEELVRKRRERNDENTQWWPAIRYVQPEEPFLERVDEYRRLLLKSISEAWNEYAPVVDGVVSKTKSS